MSAVARALWFIEHGFAGELSVGEIAAASNVSRFHLSRSFALATGQPIMAYVRARRLTVAARMLSDGAPSILAVALAVGYGSHEAFTRAFRDRFGITPEDVRLGEAVPSDHLLEPIDMNDDTNTIELAAPEIIERDAMILAGLGARYDMDKKQGITNLWQDFGPHLGNIPGQVGRVAFGLCTDFAEDGGSFFYMAATEVREADGMPEGFEVRRIPARRYLAFRHRGHISTIGQTFHAIWTQYLPESGHDYEGETFSLEYYGASFNPTTGHGHVQVWVPIKS